MVFNERVMLYIIQTFYKYFTKLMWQGLVAIEYIFLGVITFSPHELPTFAQSPHKLPTRPK
jgi:hypothetical protein